MPARTGPSARRVSRSAAWALEQMMDTLAEKIGMDPVDLRLKNVTDGLPDGQNKPYTSTGLPQCLTEGAKAFGWKEARARAKGDGPVVRGVGVASGMWGYAGPAAGPRPIVRVLRRMAAPTSTWARPISARGPRPSWPWWWPRSWACRSSRIEVENADTGTTQFSDASRRQQDGDDRFAGRARRGARSEVPLLEMAAEQLKVPAADLTLKNGEISAAAAARNRGDGSCRDLRTQQVVVGVGSARPNPADKAIRPFAAHFAEVEVNKRTGEVRVLRMLAAQDSGRVMNLLTFRNQVFGGMTMGIGFGYDRTARPGSEHRQDGERQLARLQNSDGQRRAGGPDVSSHRPARHGVSIRPAPKDWASRP